MQKIKTDNIEIIIDGDTAIINGVEYALKPKEVAEPEKPIHPFLKDVPEVGQRAYKFFPHGIGQSVDLVFPSEIDRGTVSLNRDALVELDKRRLALTALKKWIGENNIPVASEEQMADRKVWKYSFRYNYHIKRVRWECWELDCPAGDIHFFSQADCEKVRDACDALIRRAYGWPEVK